jgi:hypothetical protein
MSNIRLSGDAQELRELFPELSHARKSLAFYSSPEALAAHCASVDKSSCWYDSAWTNSRSFAGSKDMGEAVQMAQDGWPEGASRVAKLRDKINAASPVAKRFAKWDVAGAYPNIGRCLASNPLHMRRLDNAKSRRRPVITLMSDMSVNGGTSANAITNRAAVVAAIVDQIEAAGYAAHVIGFMSTSQDDLHCVCGTTIKESHQAADIGRMAYGLGHASMFRRLTWVTLQEDRFTQSLGSGLGKATELPTKDLAERNVYLVPSAARESLFASEDTTATQGLEYLIASLREQGCPAFQQ